VAKAKKDTPPTDGKPDSEALPTETVQMAAYYHWEKRGKPIGDEWYDWLEAEKEIKDWMRASGMLPSKKPTKK